MTQGAPGDEVTMSPLAGKTADVPTARDIMTPSPATFDADARLSDAYALMQERNIRHLPVLRGGKLAGMLSESDIHDALPSILTLKDPEARKKALYLTRVSQVCVKEPPRVRPDSPVVEVIALMRKSRAGCVPVVDGDAVVGIVTSGDLIDLLDRMLSGRG